MQLRAKLAASALTGLAVLALGPTAALADRAYDSAITGFRSPSSVAFDASGDAWITDGGHTITNQSNPGQNGIYEYSPYPSESLLTVPDTFFLFDSSILQLQVAVDKENGEVFVTQGNGRSVNIFSEAGTYLTSWTSIDGIGQSQGEIHAAIDNSNTISKGTVYLSLNSPENHVEAFDAAQRPVDFPATASYIDENKLTGTPSGPFGAVSSIAVDASGDIYVLDEGNNVVDEFDSTGTFVRAFTGAGSPEGFSGITGIAVDPTNGNVLVSAPFGSRSIDEFDSSANYVGQMNSVPGHSYFCPNEIEVNSQGYTYVPDGCSGEVEIFSPTAVLPNVTYPRFTNPTTTSGTLDAGVDPNGGGKVTECKFEYGTSTSYSGGEVACSPPAPYTGTQSVSAEISGLTTGTTYHYRIVVKDANGTKYGADQTYTPQPVLGLTTDPTTDVGESEATLNGTFVGSGEGTNYYFEWGLTSAYGHTSATAPGASAGSPTGPEVTALKFQLGGLNPYTTYHYRVVASHGGSGASYGQDEMFTTTPGLPSIVKEYASEVHSDRAVMHAGLNPNGAETAYQFEYVDDAGYQSSGWAHATAVPVPGDAIGRGRQYQSVSQRVAGLAPGTLYHYRVVATNDVGTSSPGAEHTFSDSCPNAHVRQQTGAALLLDCRAYELVSAANAGGYDVESNLVAGQAPFGGYAYAQNAEGEPQVLYGIHNGGIPGTGHPTNRGVDPYLATRTEHGWMTKYVGIPANDPYANTPFSSTLAEASSSLETFVFGGPEICSPCFEDGSAGNPIHLPNGELVQGMAGSISQPAAKPAGFIGRALSADGAHFVFGSTSSFEPDAEEGKLAIYDRNLDSGETHVVSKLPAGGDIACAINCERDGLGELDISSDGSHILLGKLVSEEGNARYWHLYMNVGDSVKTIDLTTSAGKGVLYDGMTADGSKVFFSSEEHLTAEDTEHSGADIFMWSESGEREGKPLTLISTGKEGAGNGKNCDPSANTVHKYWNTTGSEANCGDVAVGGGVASGDGTIYFLSPELLDGSENGVLNAPNLYVARPGQAPHFVATLESGANAPVPAAVHPFLGSFETSSDPSGVAIDHQTGDIYVLTIGTEAPSAGIVKKFDSNGHPIAEFDLTGSNTPSGGFSDYGAYGLPGEIAVNNDPSSPSHGDLYVPDFLNGVVDKFTSAGGYLGQISASLPSGVAVDPTNGNVYISRLFGGVSVFNENGNEITNFSTISNPTGLAVAPSGTVYVVNGGGFSRAEGTTESYNSSGEEEHQITSGPAYGVSVDPSNSHVYIDEGSRVSELNPSGEEIVDATPIGSGLLSGSIGLAADSGNLEVSNPGSGMIASYGPRAIPADANTDNPLVVDSVGSPGTRNTADFQVTPSGNDAVFTSTLPLAGYDNAAHREIYRYDGPAGTLICASCNPTGEQASGEASLASNGLSLTDDGRVFFNSTEGLVDRDLNNKQDVYEWEPEGFKFEFSPTKPDGSISCETKGGCIQLISTGTSPLDSSLLGASAEGTNVYFFTHDTLVSSDTNGDRVKLYDARSLGGYPQSPAPIQCMASDECHGPSSEPPPPPSIASKAATATDDLPAGHHKPVRSRKHNRGHRRHRRRAPHRRGRAK
jgi:DNA-binding beta-propeller fold protein YncE